MSSDSNYEKLSDELQNKINTELFDGNGFKDNAIRRIESDVKPSVERDKITNFIKEHNLRIVAVPSHEDVLD